MSRSLLLTGLIALSVWAGTRAKDTTGAVPSAATDGVSLKEVQSCRASVRVADAGTVNGGTLVAYYYDAVLGWVRSNTSLDCTLEANKGPSGAAPSAQVCPDTQVLAAYGRVAVASSGLVGADGGTPNGIGVDGGQNVEPVVRIECFGSNLP
jgi:hypothetical protein